MKKKQLKIITLFLICALMTGNAQAYWVWSPEEGKFVNPEGASQDSAEEQYDYAMQFYKEKNLDEALKQLENLIKKYPGARIAAEAQYRRAAIHEEKGDFWRAFQTYKELVESYPHSDRIEEVMEREFKIGNVFFSGKKAKFMGLEILPSLPRAAKVFEHIVASSPYGRFGHEAQFRLGLTRKKMAQYPKAMEAFQYLIEQYPESEFIPEARYQLAETSFLNSAAAFRDERALDQAATNVDKYLSRYGTTEEAEKAAKLHQAIDEKNAEKNYIIGHYYEKQKHLESALIYYTDVAKRYPLTRWGVKAEDRMKALRQPVEFIKGQASEVDLALNEARSQLQSLEEKSGDSIEKGSLKREIERLEQRRKAVDKNKKESIEARRSDLERREFELKEKFKKLKEKKKLLVKNPSDDLKRALDRWETSLQAEKSRLQDEHTQLLSWRSELGMKNRQFSLAMLPFFKEEISDLESVQRIDAKKFYEISGEKKDLLSEKELLYKQYGEVLALLGNDAGQEGFSPMRLASPGSMPAMVAEARKNLELLEKQLEDKKKEYEAQYGKDGWLAAPARAVTRSWDVLNPFGGGADLSKKSLEDLLERRMHVRERIAAQQTLVDTLSQAFNSELAVQEQKRLLTELESQEKTDVLDLRKSIKTLEKSIRRGYDEIDERHRHKKDLLQQLGVVVEGGRDQQPALNKTMKAVTLPAAGIVEVSRVILFGRKPKDVKITESAARDISNPETSAQADKLKEDIELESLLIEARYEKVLEMQRQLEALKAKASMSGGYKFRAAFVKIPYSFIQEAVESADRMVPRKDRQEVLIHLLDKETKSLETLKSEQAELESWIDKKSPQSMKSKTPAPPVPAAKTKGISRGIDSQKTQLQGEIESLAGKVELQRSDLTRTATRIEEPSADTPKKADKPALKNSADKADGRAAPSPRAVKKLRSELRSVEKTILKLINRESELDQAEFSILEKRIKKIDEFIEKTSSKAGAQDLLVERERIENRLAELKLRRDFLSHELVRFNVQEPVKA